MNHNRQTVVMLDDALREATDIAGDRWVLLTLGALASGSRRFGDLIAELGGIAPNVLIDRLRRMERHGLVVATLYSQRPRRYVYDLTESGRELAAVLPLLTGWATRRGGSEPAKHDVCGTALEVTMWCPSCKSAVDHGADDADLRWL
jgi:DNA-binding HxlR family transcriptional regulator